MRHRWLIPIAIVPMLVATFGYVCYVGYAGLISGSTTLTVASPTATPTPSGNFLQFGTDGQIHTGYVSGITHFPMTGYGFQYALWSGGNVPVADVQQSGINAFEWGSPNPEFYGCSAGNFARTGGTYPCGQWDQFLVDNNGVQATTGFNSYGVYTVQSTQAMTSTADQFQVSTTWGAASVNSWTAELNSLAASHLIFYQMSFDEAQVGPLPIPCDPVQHPNSWCTLLIALGLGDQSPHPQHVAFGWDTLGGQEQSNDVDPQMSDFPILEGGGSAASTSIPNTLALLSAGLNEDGQIGAIIGARGNVPTIADDYIAGPYYFAPSSDTTSTSFQPGVDWDTASGFASGASGSATTPGGVTDQAWFAVAHGYAGIRQYQPDYPDLVGARLPTTPNSRCPSSTFPNGCDFYLLQTGSSPQDATAAYGGIGQDRWQAMSASFNMIKFLEPYILQPNIAAPPGNCTAWANCTSGSMITGAKRGNGGTLVVLVNYSEITRNYSYNPSAYVTGSNAQSWKILSAENLNGNGYAICGAQTYGSRPDCGIGPTTINGVSWTPGHTTIPAAGVAPTTITTLTMQPTEVDIFLYH